MILHKTSSYVLCRQYSRLLPLVFTSCRILPKCIQKSTEVIFELLNFKKIFVSDMWPIQCTLGAQSDSEVNASGNQCADNGTDRGYTSDSELYGTQSRSDVRSSSFPGDVRVPASVHGSWLMVRLYFPYHIGNKGGVRFVFVYDAWFLWNFKLAYSRTLL